MPVINRFADFQDDIAAWRQDFHRHPEILYEVQRTAAAVAEKLREFGVDEVATGIGRTGVIGKRDVWVELDHFYDQVRCQRHVLHDDHVVCHHVLYHHVLNHHVALRARTNHTHHASERAPCTAR